MNELNIQLSALLTLAVRKVLDNYRVSITIRGLERAGFDLSSADVLAIVSGAGAGGGAAVTRTIVGGNRLDLVPTEVGSRLDVVDPDGETIVGLSLSESHRATLLSFFAQ